MYGDLNDYEVDKVIAIADKVIKVYGYCNTKGLDKLARLLKEKSDLTGKPMPYDHLGTPVNYNNAYTTGERVKDYYNDFEMTDTDYQVVAKIKEGFKKHLFTIICWPCSKLALYCKQKERGCKCVVQEKVQVSSKN